MLLPGPVLASTHGWSQANGIARDIVVAGALGLPAVQHDWDGVLQTGGSVGAAVLVSRD